MTIPESVPRFNVNIEGDLKTLKGVFIRPSIHSMGVDTKGDPTWYFIQDKYTVFSCDEIETQNSGKRVVAYIDGAMFAQILLGREITLRGMVRTVNLDHELIENMENVFKSSWGEEFVRY